MYVQDIALPLGNERNRKREDQTQDYSNKRSMKFPYNVENQRWKEENTRQTTDGGLGEL